MKKALAPGLLLLSFLFISEGFHLLKLFPFDASFVNLVLAQNLAEHFRFAFNPGELAAANDNPLFTLLLALCCRISIDPFAAAALLGKFMFAGCGWLIWRLTLTLAGDSPRAGWSAFAAAAFWFSSGMAGFNMASGLGGLSLAFTGLILMLLVLEPDTPGAILGLGAALVVLSQPAGWLLAGLALWSRQARCRSGLAEDRAAFRLALIAFAVLVLPWVLFCLSQNGTLLPNPTAAALDSAASRPGGVEFLYNWATGRGPQSLEDLYHNLSGLSAGHSWFDLVPWVAAPLLWALAWKRRAGRATMLALFILLHLGLALLGTRRTGEAGRFFMLDLAFLYILTALMLRDLAQLLERRSEFLAAAAAGLAGLALIAIQLSGTLLYQSVYQGLNQRAFHGPFSAAQWLGQNLPAEAVVATYEPGVVSFVTGRTVLDLSGRVEAHALDYRRAGDLDSLIVRQADYVIDPGFMTRLGFSPEDSTLYEQESYPYSGTLYRVRKPGDRTPAETLPVPAAP